MWNAFRVSHSQRAYDRIGHGYAVRRPDDRLAARLHTLLGDAETVVNVGAGTGNYEPASRSVAAVEPSAVMLAGRLPTSAPSVQAAAESLPFLDRSFDAALAISTIHHWSDLSSGLRELARVADLRIVYFSEPAVPGAHWLTDDYFPEIIDMPTNRAAPRAEQVAELLGGSLTIEVFEIPSDFADGAGAYWARPELYCDPDIQAGLSMFALLDGDVLERGTRLLRQDLSSGRWDERHGHWRTASSMDVGYRIVTSRSITAGPE
jgi:SAM-dependent methyltransferase